MSGTNWGRWGDADERGTLNLVTPEAVLAATQVCRTGKVYSLALPIQREGVPIFDYRGAPQRLSLTSNTDNDRYEPFGAPEGLGSNEDVLVLASHSITHMDALSHVFAEGKMYNDFGAEEYTTAKGAQHLDVAQTAQLRRSRRAARPSSSSRCRLARARPGDRPAQLEACRDAQGVELRAATSCSCAPAGSTSSPPATAATRSPASARMRCRSSTTTTSRSSAPTTPPSSASRSTTTSFSACTSSCWCKRGVTLLEHLFLVGARRRRLPRVPARGRRTQGDRRGREPDQPDRDRLTTAPGGRRSRPRRGPGRSRTKRRASRARPRGW